MSNKEKPAYQQEHQTEFKLAEKRINELIDFILAQLMKLPDIEKQDRLIYYILRAIAEEENQAFSHSFYTLVEPGTNSDLDINHKLMLFLADSRYPESDILNVILKSLSSAQGQERDRYMLEFDQYKRLVAAAVDLLDPQSLLLSLEEKITYLTQEKLVELGFSPADTAPAPELVRDYDLDWDQTFWQGPKWVYVMPKSQVHPGGMAVMVVITPTFLEETGEFGLHQTQLLVDFDHQQLAKILNNFKVPQPVIPQESELMEQLVQLPAVYKDLSNAEVVQELIKIVQPEYQSPAISLNNDNIQQYASLVRRVFSSELPNWTQDFNFQVTQRSKQRLAQFIYHVVFKGLKDYKFNFHAEMANQIQYLYQQSKTEKNKEFVTNFLIGISRLGFSPALNSFSSISQCVALSPLGAMKQFNHFSGLNKASINSLHPCLTKNFNQNIFDNYPEKEEQLQDMSKQETEHEKDALAKIDFPTVSLSDFISGYDTVIYQQYKSLYASEH